MKLTQPTQETTMFSFTKTALVAAGLTLGFAGVSLRSSFTDTDEHFHPLKECAYCSFQNGFIPGFGLC